MRTYKLILEVSFILLLTSHHSFAQTNITLQPGIDNSQQTVVPAGTQSVNYTITVQAGTTPINATELQFHAIGDGVTQLQILGKFGSPPTAGNYDCISTAIKPQCSIKQVSAGNYYFSVNPGSAGMLLTAYGNFDTPVSSYGALQVCKNSPNQNRLCDKFGNHVQLRGMSTHGINWFPWDDAESTCYSQKTMNILARDWNIDVLRVSMYPSSKASGLSDTEPGMTPGEIAYVRSIQYKRNPNKFHQMLNTFIQAAIDRDIYVLVDWHMLYPVDPTDHDYTGPFVQSELSTGEWIPSGCDASGMSKVKCYFKNVLDNFGSKSNVIYEIANEPSNIYDGNGNLTYMFQWHELKSYSDGLVSYIRNNGGANSVIVAPTLDWCSLGIADHYWESEELGVTEIMNNPVLSNGSSPDNILYTVHQYAMSQSYPDQFGNIIYTPVYRDALEYASKDLDLNSSNSRLPVFVTEYGSQDVYGNKYNVGEFEEWSDDYIDLMNSYGTSWATWNFSDDSYKPNGVDHESNAVWKPGICSSIQDDGQYKTNVENYSWYQHLKPAGQYIIKKLREVPVAIDLTVNGNSSDFTTTSPSLTPVINFASGALKGKKADWWVLYKFTQSGSDTWKYYNLSAGWANGINVSYQGPLSNLTSYQVPAVPSTQKGTYTIYFGVDLERNGSIDYDKLAYKKVVVSVQ